MFDEIVSKKATKESILKHRKEIEEHIRCILESEPETWDKGREEERAKEQELARLRRELKDFK